MNPPLNKHNRTVARNAVALSVRMIIVTLVGLYTSRMVLRALGVEDYGTYGIVGGVIILASFINKAMASATSRFITMELGKGDTEKLRQVFASAFQIHLLLCVVVIVFGETVGLWFVNAVMNFPPGSMTAVNVIYQLAILSTVFAFTQVPYNAVIIAHERMGIYAVLELVNSVLKLIIVFALFLFNDNRLIVFGVLMAAVSILMTMLYRIYCIKHYPEARVSRKIHKEIIRPMLTFSSYSLFNSFGVLANSQGKPIVLNLFFGVVANAASSLALTVVGAVEGLTTSISQAFYPRIIKEYAADDILQMQHMLRRAIQFTLMAFAAIAIPVILEAGNVLYLWLGQIPQYSAGFLKLIMCVALINVFINSLYIAIQATGKIRIYSFFAGIIFSLCPVIAYIILLFVANPDVVYLTEIGLCLVLCTVAVTLTGRLIPTLNCREILLCSLKSYAVIALVFLTVSLLKGALFPAAENPAESDIGDILASVVYSVLLSWGCLLVLYPAIALNRAERNFLCDVLAKSLKSIRAALTFSNTR